MATLPETKWRTAPRDSVAESKLADQLSVSKLTAAILLRRGLSDPASALKFLNPDLSHLHDPSLLPDYEIAETILVDAIRTKKRIFIHGDYDVDGVTSAALLHRFLSKRGAITEVHVPHRIREGYGVHISAIDRAIAFKADIFLTCDCGTSAYAAVEAAKQAGMIVIVTDHHQPSELLPRADAIVNPHMPNSQYPFREICGAGVAFKLCAGITRALGEPLDKFYMAYLDLAVLGTIADVMPLIDENRVIARFGLARLLESRKIGIQQILAHAIEGKPRSLTPHDLGFRIAPRLNAAGRIDDAAVALNVLLTEDQAEAKTMAARLEEINLLRRTLMETAVDEARAQIIENNHTEQNGLVVFSPAWHPGVVGLVASRLVDSYYRPSFALTSDGDDKLKGSGRSIIGFNLFDFIKSNDDILGGGGHMMAAGVHLKRADLPLFIERVHQAVTTSMSPEELVPRASADVEIYPGETSLEVAEEFERLEPCYGESNPPPMLVARGVTVLRSLPIKDGQHLRIFIEEQNGDERELIWFGANPDIDVSPGRRFDIAFTLLVNEYAGKRKIQWKVKDLDPR